VYNVSSSSLNSTTPYRAAYALLKELTFTLNFIQLISSTKCRRKYKWQWTNWSSVKWFKWWQFL